MNDDFGLKPAKNRQAFRQIVTLGILNALTPFSIDLYLPAFPEIAMDLNSTAQKVSLSVSTYFIGFALGQIFYGPLLDRFGRKLPLYVGLLIYILASIGCMTTHSVEALMVFRFISALGACASSVGAMALVRDLFPPQDGAKIFSMLMLVLSVSPLLAPSVGSFVVTVWGWRILFGILAFLAALDIALVRFALPDAYLPDRTVSMRIKPILSNFMQVLKEPSFYIYTFAGSLSFAGLFVYVASSPAIFMDGFGVSPKMFGGIFAILACAMIGGGQLNHLLIKRFGSRRTFKTALTIQAAVGLIFFLNSLFVSLGMVSIIAFLFVLLGCAGVTYPNAAALALAPFSKNIGSASALLGFLQLSVGSLAAALVGVMNIKGILPTAAVISVFSAGGLALVVLTRKLPEAELTSYAANLTHL